MATYVEVVRFEEDAPPNTVRLIKSGEFYRAYNHSAWLFQCCIAKTCLPEQLKFVNCIIMCILSVSYDNMI